MPVPRSIARIKPPMHQPLTWKQNNRLLQPGLPAAEREDYRERIVTPKTEPTWSRTVGYINLLACSGVVAYLVFFVDFGTHDHGFQRIRQRMDNWWAENWCLHPWVRRRLEKKRMIQDAKIREQERLLDEKIAKRQTMGGRAQPA